MIINFSNDCDPYGYRYISCFFNLRSHYIFVSKKACYSSLCALSSSKCKRVWEIHDVNNSTFSGIVRNPYGRLESLYKDKVLLNVDPNGGLQLTQKEIVNIFGKDRFFGKNISFEDFIFAMPKLIATECHFFPQSKFIPSFVTAIHHMESYNEINEAFSLFDSESIICNKTEPIQLFWSSKMYEIINSIYNDDFIRFGYELCW